MTPPPARILATIEGRDSMAIGNAVQKGSFIYIYDERGRQLAMLSAGSGPNDGIKGYTGTTVNVRRGSFIYSYDEKGRQTAMMSAK